MSRLSLHGLTKRYGRNTVVEHAAFDLAEAS